MSHSRNPEQTRQLILERALDQMHRQGFQAASVNDILDQTGLTRGALYHHYPSKRALGLAVLDAIDQMIADFWLQPLADTDDPIAALQGAMARAGRDIGADDLILGCPLNNLSQELSSRDEEFRTRMVAAYNTWINGWAQAFARGQRAGTVAADIDPVDLAVFCVASLTGGRGLAKTARDTAPLAACVISLSRFLDTLRP